jgi:hypothetical protein
MTLLKGTWDHLKLCNLEYINVYKIPVYEDLENIFIGSRTYEYN